MLEKNRSQKGSVCIRQIGIKSVREKNTGIKHQTDIESASGLCYHRWSDMGWWSSVSRLTIRIGGIYGQIPVHYIEHILQYNEKGHKQPNTSFTSILCP